MPESQGAHKDAVDTSKGRSASLKDWPNLELFEHKMKLESVKMEIYKLMGDRERW